MQSFFLEVVYSGKYGEIWAKYPSHPQNYFTCSYTPMDYDFLPLLDYGYK